MTHLSKVRGHPFKKSVSNLQSFISYESPHHGFDKTADLEQPSLVGRDRPRSRLNTFHYCPALSVIPGQVSPKSFEGSKPPRSFDGEKNAALFCFAPTYNFQYHENCSSESSMKRQFRTICIINLALQEIQDTNNYAKGTLGHVITVVWPCNHTNYTHTQINKKKYPGVLHVMPHKLHLILPHKTRRTAPRRIGARSGPPPRPHGWCTSPAGTGGCGAPSCAAPHGS